MTPVRVVHIITGLGIGGAETMLAKLLEAEVAAGLHRTIEVICLGVAGPMADRIRATGISLTCLGMGPGGSTGTWQGLRALAARLRRLDPDIVQSWMYHADLLGGLVARWAVPRAARIWSIRASSMPYPASLRTRAIIRTCAMLSSVVPAKIISCSRTAANLHVSIGYDERRIVVIPNGFDCQRFAPSPDAHHALVDDLQLPHTTAILGCVARFDPQKDFPTLLRAFHRVIATRPDTALVLIGKGCTPDNDALRALIAPECASRVLLLGARQDIPALTAGFDIALLTSAYGEGFPNVLGEAIACGVPCVSTDVGDARDIVGAEGFVANIGDHEGIAAGVVAILGRSGEERRRVARQLRERAVQDYELSSVARRYWRVQDALGPDAMPLRVPA